MLLRGTCSSFTNSVLTFFLLVHMILILECQIFLFHQIFRRRLQIAEHKQQLNCIKDVYIYSTKSILVFIKVKFWLSSVCFLTILVSLLTDMNKLHKGTSDVYENIFHVKFSCSWLWYFVVMVLSLPLVKGAIGYKLGRLANVA